MTSIVVTLIVFVTVGAVFLAANLLVGRLVRPNTPTPEKGQAYECGEEPVGSPWGQFDLRFYVVALLFVLFDVEIAFFFPWGVVFGTANRMTTETEPAARVALMQKLDPSATVALTPAAASEFAVTAFVEMFVFFGILMLGFAYVWHRGDLEWVRSLNGQLPTADN